MHQENDEEDFYASGNVRDNENGEMDHHGSGHNGGPPLDTDGMDVNEMLIEARKVLIKDLIQAIHDGYATPADKAVLRGLLKDNGVIMGDPTEGANPNGKQEPELPESVDEVPKFEKPSYY